MDPRIYSPAFYQHPALAFLSGSPWGGGWNNAPVPMSGNIWGNSGPALNGFSPFYAGAPSFFQQPCYPQMPPFYGPTFCDPRQATLTQFSMIISNMVNMLGQYAAARQQQTQQGGPQAPTIGGPMPLGPNAPNGATQLGSAVPRDIRRWEPQIMNAARKYDVPPALIAAVIQSESGGDPGLTSSAGAKGLMQLMDGTFGDMQKKHNLPSGNVWDPATNIEAGTAYLKLMSKKYPGDWRKALAAYNTGFGNVDQNNVSRATWNYADTILRNWNLYSQGSPVS